VATIVAELLERVGLPAGFSALGIDQDDLDAVARMSQAHPGLTAATARDQWTEDEVATLLSEAR
jgi:alcohol dehydrogenase class IV